MHPLAEEDSVAKERIARGAMLEDIYPDDYSDSEGLEIEVKTQEPRQEAKETINYYNSSDILKYVSLLGKASLHLNVRASNLGGYNEQSYFLDIFNGKKTDEVFLGTFDRTEEPPAQQVILEEVQSFLEKDYKVTAQGDKLDILGYKSDEAKIGAMQEIYHKIHSYEQIPLMKDFLREYFPKSNYASGKEHDLDRVSATAVVIQFNNKYNQVRRKVEGKKE